MDGDPGLPPRYGVCFYDAHDGWGTSWFDTDDLEAARVRRDAENATLPQENKDYGEHWGVVDMIVGHEIECQLSVLRSRR